MRIIMEPNGGAFITGWVRTERDTETAYGFTSSDKRHEQPFWVPKKAIVEGSAIILGANHSTQKLTVLVKPWFAKQQSLEGTPAI